MNPSGESNKRGEKKRLQTLQQTVKKQKTIIQDLKERNLVLEQRQKLSSGVEQNSLDLGESISSAHESPIAATDADVQRLNVDPPTPLPLSLDPKFEVGAKSPSKALAVNASAAERAEPSSASLPKAISVSSEKTGEHFLYSKVLETYRSRNTKEMQKTVELLLKSYPDSVFADNAIYLAGLSAFEREDYKTALEEFSKLERSYPQSNKVVSARFAKASIEKRLGRVREARRGFLQIKDIYPGSPEAARVSVELKLLDASSSKHREL